MKEDKILNEVVDWYAKNCNGDWEHSFGLKIDTLDNPGWRVEFDLAETELSSANMAPKNIERSESDWYRCFVKENVFYGYGGIRNLSEILKSFLEFSKSEQS